MCQEDPGNSWVPGVLGCASARRTRQELLPPRQSWSQRSWRSPGWPRARPWETQDSIFSFFLPFFRKDGVRNFFFFLEGDLEGEPSGDTGLLVTVSFSLGASWSVLVVVRSVSPFPRFSSVLGSSPFPFTTAGGSFLAVGSGGAWLSSSFLSPWEGEREQGIGAAALVLWGGFIPPNVQWGLGRSRIWPP